MNQMISDKPLYNIVMNITNFIGLNILFLAANVLFLLVFFFNISSPILLFISLMPLAPALAGLFYATGKFMRAHELSFFKDFMKGYANNAKTAFKYGLVKGGLLTVLLINYRQIVMQEVMHPFFLLTLLLILFIICLTLFAFPIMVRFEMTVKNLYLLALVCFFKQFKLTLLNVTTVTSFLIIYFRFPFLSLLLLPSVMVYFINFNLRHLLMKLEVQGGSNRVEM